MLLGRLVRTFAESLLYLVYPKACWVCGRLLPVEAGLICAECAALLTSDPHPTCPRCSNSVGPYVALTNGCPRCRDEVFHFDQAFRLGPYESSLRDVILRMKYSGGEGLAEAMAWMFAARLAEKLGPLQPSVVIPIPLHWTRQFRRGFNQSDILARRLAKTLRAFYRPNWLRRTRRTPLQTQQPSPAARQANVHGAFAAKAGLDLRGQTIVLVDDVLTTGATASEAARALRAAKPERIVVAVLAHGR